MGDLDFDIKVTRIHESLVAKRHSLAIKYFDTDVKLELLYLIYLKDRDPSWGIGDYVSCLTSAPQSNSSISAFVREMLDTGVLEATEGVKQTRKHLRMSSQLMKEFKQMVNYSNHLARTNFSRSKKNLVSGISPHKLKGGALG